MLVKGDVAEWAHVVYGELPCRPAEGPARAAIAAAGPGYFAAARSAAEGASAGAHVAWAPFVEALKAGTGRRGRELMLPLRAALTHRLDGPELGELLKVLPGAEVAARLERARIAAEPDRLPS